MRLKRGATRIVFVCGDYVYKIARIKFLHTFFRGLSLLVARDSAELKHLQEKHKANMVQKILRQCFIGFYANWSEAEYWSRTHDPRCVPVVKVWLGGFVIVQRSAAVITRQQLSGSPLQVLTADPELKKSRQYGLYLGQVRLVDYAHWGMDGFQGPVA